MVETDKMLIFVASNSEFKEKALNEIEKIFSSHPEKFKKKKENIFSVSCNFSCWSIVACQDEVAIIRKNPLKNRGIIYEFKEEEPLYGRINSLFKKIKKLFVKENKTLYERISSFFKKIKKFLS